MHHFGYLGDPEVRWLYRHSSGFVLPSLLEGFGVPPLEAAQRGLLSVVSRDGAQKEVLGDAGILVDPLSVDDIARGLRQIVDMPQEERLRRIAQVRQQADLLTQERYLSRWQDLLSSASLSDSDAVHDPDGFVDECGIGLARS